MTDRMAFVMAGAIANRMAKPMRFGWQNDAPNPNPNPNPNPTCFRRAFVCVGFSSKTKLQSVTRARAIWTWQ